MTVLTIRSHKRYATRQTVQLSSGRSKAVNGLLIELSAEGLRISNLRELELAIAQEVTMIIGEDEYHGRVRWAHDGIAGVRLDRALHGHEIAGLLEQGRTAAPLRLAS